jgi:hypothetical protein
MSYLAVAERWGVSYQTNYRLVKAARGEDTP